MGSAIGPGSNSQFISIQRLSKKNTIELGIEIVDNDNDFTTMHLKVQKITEDIGKT